MGYPNSHIHMETDKHQVREEYFLIKSLLNENESGTYY